MIIEPDSAENLFIVSDSALVEAFCKLILRVKLIKIRLGTANMDGIAMVNNKIVAKANFIATIVDRNNE